MYDDEPVVFNVDDALSEKICVSPDNRFSHGPEGSAAEDEIGLVAHVEVGDHHRGSFGAAKSGVVASDLKASTAASAVFVDGRNGGGDVTGEESRSHGTIRTSSGCKARQWMRKQKQKQKRESIKQ